MFQNEHLVLDLTKIINEPQKTFQTFVLLSTSGNILKPYNKLMQINQANINVKKQTQVLTDGKFCKNQAIYIKVKRAGLNANFP